MSAGGFPFRADAAYRWWAHHGTAAHRFAAPDLHGITASPERAVLEPVAAMAVGLYVVVDSDDLAQYIGKVCRDDPSAIRSRFATHHAATNDWAAVWLLPLRDDCPRRLVLRLEAEMIRAYRPCGNVHHAHRATSPRGAHR